MNISYVEYNLVPFKRIDFVFVQPPPSVIVKSYKPDVRPVTVVPVCPVIVGDQLKLNGGVPSVMYTSILPSFPSIGSIIVYIKSTQLDGAIKIPFVCIQGIIPLSVTSNI